MNPHQRHAISEATDALDEAAKLARENGDLKRSMYFVCAAQGLQKHFWRPAPNSLGEILIPLVPEETAPPSEEFLRNYAHHAAKI